VARGFDVVTAKQQALMVLDRQVAAQASVLAFSKIYLLSGALLMCALPLLFVFRTGKSRGLGPGAAH
jgi:DHA2 family multidrug resistance protein